MMADPGRVAVAMSGGVDSGVAAVLLAEAGYEIVGVTLDLHPGTDHRGSGAEAESARQAAEAAGGRHVLIEARRAFTDRIIHAFAAGYAAGRTPNPCVWCNQRIKWGLLRTQARDLGAGLLATGHYARLAPEAGGPVLRTAGDRTADQSYVLWSLPRSALAGTLLPLGGMSREEVRGAARAYGLTAAVRDPSQDICFTGGSDYGAFLDRISSELDDPGLAAALRRALEPGEIVDAAGRVLGRHRGIARYTIGQRQGLGVAAGRPLYVTAIDPAAHRITVGNAVDLERRGLQAVDANWVSIEPPAAPFRAGVQIRYRGPRPPALVTPLAHDRFEVRFDEPQRAVTPGQSAVLYEGEIVLGGGIITG